MTYILPCLQCGEGYLYDGLPAGGKDAGNALKGVFDCVRICRNV